MTMVAIPQVSTTATCYRSYRGSSSAPDQSADDGAPCGADTDPLSGFHVAVMSSLLLRCSVMICECWLYRPQN
jgi:hypothetical protein